MSKLFVLVEGLDHQLLISTMLVKVLEIFEVAAHFGVCEFECSGVTCGVAQVHAYQRHIVGVVGHNVGKVGVVSGRWAGCGVGEETALESGEWASTWVMMNAFLDECTYRQGSTLLGLKCFERRYRSNVFHQARPLLGSPYKARWSFMQYPGFSYPCGGDI